MHREMKEGRSHGFIHCTKTLFGSLIMCAWFSASDKIVYFSLRCGYNCSITTITNTNTTANTVSHIHAIYFIPFSNWIKLLNRNNWVPKFQENFRYFGYHYGSKIGYGCLIHTCISYMTRLWMYSNKSHCSIRVINCTYPNNTRTRLKRTSINISTDTHKHTRTDHRNLLKLLFFLTKCQ